MREFSDGICTLDIYDSPLQYLIPRGEYTQLLAAWKRGDAFLSWTGNFGQTMTVKGARVEQIGDWSSDSWDAMNADRAARAVKGGD